MVFGVYFIACGGVGSSTTKIGVTSDLQKRIDSLQTGNPYRLRCIAYIECHKKEDAYKLENYLHRKLKRFRLMGEWFRSGSWDLKELLDKYIPERILKGKVTYKSQDQQGSEQIRKLEDENISLRVRVRELEARSEEKCEIGILHESLRLQ